MTGFLAVLSGALLAGAVTLMEPWLGVAALVLVIAGWWLRPSAVAAVLLAIGALAVADTTVIHAAATGVVATAYLLNAATVAAPRGVVPTTVPSVAGAVVFAAVAVLVALLPLRLAWAPVAAPIAVILLYATVIQGLARRHQAGPDTAG